ncbi:hypothetical protein Tco_0184512 [Tanacetum coccineum]
MGNEELSTIPEKESDEFIKSSVEDLFPTLSSQLMIARAHSKGRGHRGRHKTPVTDISNMDKSKPKRTKIRAREWKEHGKLKPKAYRSLVGQPIVQIVLWYLDSDCSKHMTGDRSQLTNFISKFLGTVKFGNDHVAKIMGYEDYQIGKVLQFQGFNYVEGLFRHNLCSMVKFCIPSSKLCFDGVPLLSCLLFQVLVLKPSLVDGIRSSLYVNFGAINHLARQCLVRGLPKLKFEKDHLGSLCAVGLRAEEPHKPNLRNTNQRINSICIAQGSVGLVPNPHPSTPFVPPLRTDWDMLFQPLFDEFLNPSPSVDHPAPEVVVPINEVIAPVLADSTGSPSSTTVDQDAPSLIAHMGNDPYFGVPIPEIPSDQSSSSDSIHTIVHPDHQISEHNSKWTKDHPLENIIGELARPVSTRLQYMSKLFSITTCFPHWLLYLISYKMLDSSCWIEKQCQGRIIDVLSTCTEPDGFMDIDNPNYVFKLKKALLWVENMTPHAWYDLLSWFLIYHDFSKGSVDPTLFIRREGKELLLVIDLLAWSSKAEKALTYPVREAEYIALSAVVFKSFGCDHSLPTMALDSIKFQCTVITKALLPYNATTFNIPDPSI